MKRVIELSIAYEDKEKAKRVPGARWNKTLKKWTFPISHINLLKKLFPLRVDEIEDLYLKYKMSKEEYEEKERQRMDSRKDQLVRRNIAAEAAKINIPVNMHFTVKPFKHQMDMFKIGLVEDQLAFFCEMGTGKTKVTVDLIMHKVGIKRVIIIVPKSVIKSWVDEFDKHGFTDYNIIDGSKAKRIEKLSEDIKVSIINYDGMLVLRDKKQLFKQFNTCILDESSYIKNPRAQRTKLINQFFSRCQYKYILSGTPMPNEVTDLYSQLKFINRLEDFSSFYAFRNTYCEMGGYGNYQIVKRKHIDDLQYRIDQCSIQIKKKECNFTIPKLYTKRVLDQSPQLKKQYEEMKQQCILELQDEEVITADIVLTKLLRLQQINSGHFLDNQKHNNKLKETQSVINEVVVENKNKLIIFYHFKLSGDILEDKCNDLGVRTHRLDGSSKDRDGIVDAFRAEGPSVFICQISAGGIGLNLQVSSTVLYYENSPFRLAERVQSEDRIHRFGQKDSCLYIDLIYDNTIDKDLLKAIETKSNLATYLVNSFVSGDYSLKGKQVVGSPS